VPPAQSRLLLAVVLGCLVGLIVLGGGVAAVLLVSNQERSTQLADAPAGKHDASPSDRVEPVSAPRTEPVPPAPLPRVGQRRPDPLPPARTPPVAPPPGDQPPSPPPANDQPADTPPPADSPPANLPSRIALEDRRPVMLDDREPEPATRPAVWRGNTAPVLTVAFSADGRLALSGSGHLAYKKGVKLRRSDNTVRVWDAWKGEDKKHLPGFDDTLSSVAFSPQGKYAVFSISGRWNAKREYIPSKDHSIRLWDLETERELPSLKAMRQGTARTLPAPGGFEVEPRFKGHDDEVWCVAYCPDGRSIASGGRDGTVRAWDVETGDQRWCYDAGKTNIHWVAFSAAGDRIVCGSYDHLVRVLDARTGQLLHTLRDHGDIVFGVAFSADGRRVASGGGSRPDPNGPGFIDGMKDYVVRVWDAQSGEVVARLSGHTGVVMSVAFSPDGRRVVSGGHDNTVRVWDVASGRELRHWTGHTEVIRGVAVSPDGRFALSGADDYDIRLWEMPPTVRDLLAAIEKKDGKGLARVAGDLDALGDDVQAAVPPLVGLLKSGSEDLTGPALDILGRKGRVAPEQARDLAALLPVSTPGVRSYARAALVGLAAQARPALPRVLEVLRHNQDPAIWIDALAVLDKLGDSSPETRDVLVRLGLAHAQTGVREEALGVLLHLAPDALEIDALLDMLRREKSPKMLEIVGRGLQQRLAERTRETLGPVHNVLRPPSSVRVQLLGLEVVQRLKGDAAELVPDVMALLNSSDDTLRVRALQALQAVGKPAEAAVPELLKMSDTGPAALRLPATLALCGIAPGNDKVIAAALPVLLEGLKPAEKPTLPDAERAPIAAALRAIGEPAAEPLLQALEKARGTGAALANYRKYLLEALARLGKLAYSEDNVKRLKDFARKELYKDVQVAAYKAITAMQP
jgi:WD40 repeat protein